MLYSVLSFEALPLPPTSPTLLLPPCLQLKDQALSILPHPLPNSTSSPSRLLFFSLSSLLLLPHFPPSSSLIPLPPPPSLPPSSSLTSLPPPPSLPSLLLPHFLPSSSLTSLPPPPSLPPSSSLTSLPYLLCQCQALLVHDGRVCVGHSTNQSDAPSQSSRSTGCKVLLVGVARLPYMNMGINETRESHCPVGGDAVDICLHFRSFAESL